MDVVAIKPAFFNGSLIYLGQRLEIPDNTTGSWFAPADSDQAMAAMKIKASGSTPHRVLDALARGKTPDLTDPEPTQPLALSNIGKRKPVSFIDVMNAR